MQTKIHPQMKSPILLVLIAGIGDLVLSSMGLRAIRKGFPFAELHLLTSVEASQLGKNYPYIDRVWPFPIRQLRRDRRAVAGVAKTIWALRAYRFEIIVNLYQVASPVGALLMGGVFSLLRSPIKIGHNRHGFGLFLNRKTPANFFENRHMADSILEMAKFAGGVPDRDGIHVFRAESINSALKDLLDFGPERPNLKTIAVNPGGDSEEKRANPRIFSSSVNKIAASMDVKAIILGGPGEEEIAGKIASEIHCPILNLAGKISLNDLVYVLERSDLVITNDSGPMHIAAALQKPLVALYSGGIPDIFGPYGNFSSYRTIKIERSEVNKSPNSVEATAEMVAALCRELI